jgi:TnpA family transposase
VRVHGGLNKGEARNALARTVFFHRLGEIRDRSYENQRYRASGLNLVIAAITLWNTVYLERAVNALRERGTVNDALLGHLAPLKLESHRIDRRLQLARQQAGRQGRL